MSRPRHRLILHRRKAMPQRFEVGVARGLHRRELRLQPDNLAFDELDAGNMRPSCGFRRSRSRIPI